MTTKTASRIGEIKLVIVASTDQDRSVKFYEELGPQGSCQETALHRRRDAPAVELHDEVGLGSLGSHFLRSRALGGSHGSEAMRGAVISRSAKSAATSVSL